MNERGVVIGLLCLLLVTVAVQGIIQYTHFKMCLHMADSASWHATVDNSRHTRTDRRLDSIGVPEMVDEDLVFPRIPQ